jgi:hypothetical protein
MDEKFENLCKEMHKCFEKVGQELKEIRCEIARLNIQVAKMEVRLDERTLRVGHYVKRAENV